MRQFDGISHILCSILHVLAHSCGVNERSNPTGACQRTCNACRDCTSCLCKPGYIRTKLGEDCVSEKDCHNCKCYVHTFFTLLVSSMFMVVLYCANQLGQASFNGHIQQSVKHPVKYMIWEFFTANGTGSLVFIHSMMNSISSIQKYIQKPLRDRFNTTCLHVTFQNQFRL